MRCGGSTCRRFPGAEVRSHEHRAGGLFFPNLHNRQPCAVRYGDEHRMCRISWKPETVQFFPRANPTPGAVGILALLGSKPLSVHFLSLSFEARMV
jgi:hypothetical protein